MPGFSTTENRRPSHCRPRSSTFGEDPPPQHETVSAAALASGVPMCSEVIQMLAIPAQVMLPEPAALPMV